MDGGLRRPQALALVVFLLPQLAGFVRPPPFTQLIGGAATPCEVHRCATASFRPPLLVLRPSTHRKHALQKREEKRKDEQRSSRAAAEAASVARRQQAHLPIPIPLHISTEFLCIHPPPGPPHPSFAHPSVPCLLVAAHMLCHPHRYESFCAPKIARHSARPRPSSCRWGTTGCCRTPLCITPQSPPSPHRPL